MDFDAVVDELYGLPPGDFIDARERRVKEARATGDRELANRVHELRRPTVAAWLVNLLARGDRDAVDRLLALGDALREAQATLSGAELRNLSTERRRVIEALARTVREMAAEAGQEVGTETQREVEATLEAALADSQAAAAVSSGRLTTSLRYSGFGEVDVDGAVATPSPARATSKGKATQTSKATSKATSTRRPPGDRAPAAADRDRDRLKPAREAAEAADRALREAERRLSDSDNHVAEATDRKQSAKAAVDRLSEELERARADLTAAERERKDAAGKRARAERAAESARNRAARAREALNRLQE